MNELIAAVGAYFAADALFHYERKLKPQCRALRAKYEAKARMRLAYLNIQKGQSDETEPPVPQHDA